MADLTPTGQVQMLDYSAQEEKDLQEWIADIRKNAADLAAQKKTKQEDAERLRAAKERHQRVTEGRRRKVKIKETDFDGGQTINNIKVKTDQDVQFTGGQTSGLEDIPVTMNDINSVMRQIMDLRMMIEELELESDTIPEGYEDAGIGYSTEDECLSSDAVPDADIESPTSYTITTRSSNEDELILYGIDADILMGGADVGWIDLNATGYGIPLYYKPDNTLYWTGLDTHFPASGDPEESQQSLDLDPVTSLMQIHNMSAADADTTLYGTSVCYRDDVNGEIFFGQLSIPANPTYDDDSINADGAGAWQIHNWDTGTPTGTILSTDQLIFRRSATALYYGTINDLTDYIHGWLYEDGSPLASGTYWGLGQSYDIEGNGCWGSSIGRGSEFPVGGNQAIDLDGSILYDNLNNPTNDQSINWNTRTAYDKLANGGAEVFKWDTADWYIDFGDDEWKPATGMQINATVVAGDGVGALRVPNGGAYLAEGLYSVKGGADQAGYFVSPTFQASLCIEEEIDTNAAGYFTDGTTMARIVDGQEAAYFVDSTGNVVYIGNDSYAIETVGDVYFGGDVLVDGTADYIHDGYRGATKTDTLLRIPCADGSTWEGYIRGGILTTT